MVTSKKKSRQGVLLVVILISLITGAGVTRSEDIGDQDGRVKGIIEAVRRAQRPCENMRVEWTWELTGQGVRTVTTRRSTTPAKKGGWKYTYTAVLAGIRSKVDLHAQYYVEGAQKPRTAFTEVGVFDGTKFKSLNRYTLGQAARRKPRVVINARDTNLSIRRNRLFDDREDYDFKKLREKYTKVSLTDGKVRNVHLLDLVTESGVIRRVTIDGNKGFNVTKIQMMRADGSMYYEINYEVKQYDDKHWFVAGYEFLRHPRPAQAGGCVPVVERKAVVSRVEFDVDVRDDMFELEVPDGAEVHDCILNILYFTSPGEDKVAEMPGNLPDYSDLKAAIEIAYAARDKLLAGSRGKARLTLEKNSQSEQVTERLRERIRNELRIEPRKVALLGRGSWTVDWYNKGPKKRYDMLVEKDQKSAKDQPPLLLPQNKRIATDGAKGIHYNVLTNEAYINKPSIRTDNPANLINYFRIERLYRCTLGTLPEMLNRYDEHLREPAVYREKADGHYCIKLEYTTEGDLSSGKKYKTSVAFWVSPQMSYALVKAEFRSSKRTGGGEPPLVEGYYASYEESDKFRGIWLLKDVRMICNDGPLREKLTASVTDTELGIEIPDSTFTFEGLEVPAGTSVHDRTQGRRRPVIYSYRPGEARQGLYRAP